MNWLILAGIVAAVFLVAIFVAFSLGVCVGAKLLSDLDAHGDLGDEENS